MEQAGGGTYYYLGDGLNSVTEMVDSGGSILNSYVYDSFGTIVDKNETITNPITYTSRELDLNGLYYYRARFYDSVSGRFLSEDPIGFLGGVNFYVYVGNSPINYFDPLGLKPVFCNPTTGECFDPEPNSLGFLVPNSIGCFGLLGPMFARWNNSDPLRTVFSATPAVGLGGGLTFCYKIRCNVCPTKDVPIIGIPAPFISPSLDTNEGRICIDIGAFRGPIPLFHLPIDIETPY